MMKVVRYSARGSIQRKGTTATSWQILFVVASSMIEPAHGRRVQIQHRDRWELRSGSVWSEKSAFRNPNTPHIARARPNTTNAHDHRLESVLRVNSGSKRNGNVMSAASEPKFDSAYNR